MVIRLVLMCVNCVAPYLASGTAQYVVTVIVIYNHWEFPITLGLSSL